MANSAKNPTSAAEKEASEMPLQLMEKASSKRACVLVLGMHRSGTSAITRVLSIMGAALPQHVMPPARGNNELGFWEPERLSDLHDEMLTEAGSHWGDWRQLNLSALSVDRIAHFKVEICKHLNEEYGEARIFVLKDPRICRFVPLYLEALRDAGVEPRIVLAVRNPLEVAASLSRRDGMGHAHAGLLWLRHTLEPEVATRGLPRTIVSYETLLEDWREVAEKAGIASPQKVEEIATKVEEFLSPSLRHHARSVEDVFAEPAVRNWIGQTFSALLELERCPDAEPVLQKLDCVREEFERAAPLIAELQAELNRAHEAELSERDRVHQAEISERDRAKETAVAELTNRFEKAESELRLQLGRAYDHHRALEQEADHLRLVLNDVVTSTSWRLTGGLRRLFEHSPRIRNYLRAAVGGLYYIKNSVRDRSDRHLNSQHKAKERRPEQAAGGQDDPPHKGS